MPKGFKLTDPNTWFKGWGSTRLGFIRLPHMGARILNPSSWTKEMLLWGMLAGANTWLFVTWVTSGAYWALDYLYTGVILVAALRAAKHAIARHRDQISILQVSIVIMISFYMIFARETLLHVVTDLVTGVNTQGWYPFSVVWPQPFATRTIDPVEGSMLFLLTGAVAIITIAGNEVIGATFGIVFTFVAASYAIQLAASGRYSLLVDAGRRLGFVGGGLFTDMIGACIACFLLSSIGYVIATNWEESSEAEEAEQA